MSVSLRNEIEEYIGGNLPNNVVIPGWSPRLKNRIYPPLSSRAISNKTTFAFTSRITAHKGTNILLQSVKKLVDADFKEFEVSLYGAGEVGWFLYEATALGVLDFINYRGVATRNEIMSILEQHDALLFPTMPREPFGFVVAEAAASRCIPILTAGAGAGEWLLDGVNSIKISRSSEGLAEAMAVVICMSDHDKENFKSSAKEVADQFFNFDTIIQQVEEMAVELVKRTSTLDWGKRTRGVEAALAFLDSQL